MPQPVLKSIFTLLLIVSACGTFQLGRDYVQALFGTPDAQWQFAFALAPMVIFLGAAAIVIARLHRPPLPRILTLGAWLATLVPVALSALVGLHAY